MIVTKAEQKLLGFISVMALAFTAGMCFLVVYFPNLHNVATGLKDTWYLSSSSDTSVLELLMQNPTVVEADEETLDELLKGHQLRFEIPSNMNSKAIEITTSPVDYITNIRLTGVKPNYFYAYPMIGTTENVMDITYENSNDVGLITISLDDVLEPVMTREDKYLYLDFVDPHEIYDYVVVFDAGHGAGSVGTIKNDVYEKDINLDILLCVKKLFDDNPYNIGVYYTKLTDVNTSYPGRLNLANYSDADAYISIHNNATATGRTSSVSGTEVMYRGSDTTGESKKLASICLKHVTEKCGSKDRGCIVGDEVYIVREAKVPVALIEVGFMTNSEELKKLQDPDYQMRVAEGVRDSVYEYLGISDNSYDDDEEIE